MYFDEAERNTDSECMLHLPSFRTFSVHGVSLVYPFSPKSFVWSTDFVVPIAVYQSE